MQPPDYDLRDRAPLWKPNAPGPVHFVFEGSLLALSLGAVVYLWGSWMRTHRSLAQARSASEGHREARDAWRARAEKLLRGLGEEIDLQLRRWSLTPTEREVALLLLKGYGHKEIAALLDRSDRTVRQHAVPVYRKSGLSGRVELAAKGLASQGDEPRERCMRRPGGPTQRAVLRRDQEPILRLLACEGLQRRRPHGPGGRLFHLREYQPYVVG